MFKISVVMPLYNGEKYILEAVESVLNQTCKEFELIIVDDGSTDNSVKIVKSFKDERIKLIESKHAGIVEALNLGIRISQGEYIIRADADDVSELNRFEILLNYMEANKDISITGSWATTMNKNGEKIGTLEFPPITHAEIKRYTLRYCPFIHPSLIIKKKTLDEVGYYKNFRYVEDYELWTRVLQKNKAHNVPQYLVKYRIHDDQITKKKNLTLRRLIGIYIRVLAVIRY